MRKNERYILLGIPAGILLIFILLVIYIHSNAYSGALFSQQSRKIHIYLQGDKAVADKSSALKIDDNNRIIIYEAGTYCFEGQLDNGQIVVNAGNDDEVTIRFDGVDIQCEDSSALWIRNAGKVVLKLKSETENHLSDGMVYKQEAQGVKQPTACIYSRAKLDIRTSSDASEDKEGILVLEAYNKHGIFCSKDMKIKSGSIMISAVNTAITVKDDLTITGGSLGIQSGKDGIYCEENALLQGRVLTIDARRYGVFGRSSVKIADSCQLEFLNVISQTASSNKE